MRRQLWMMAAALLLMACSDASDVLTGTPKASESEGTQTVDFGVYTSRSLTRAGASGDMTTAALTTEAGNIKNAGFGVFGYYTGSDLYRQTAQPNFMYNQQVKYSASNKFEYTPLKYWPNEHAEAVADETDHVTFFAYAPYVDVYRTSGQLNGEASPKDANGTAHARLQNAGDAENGITGLTKMGDYGDPLVNYIVATDLSKRVDLCWGTVKDHPDAAVPDATTAQWGPGGSEVTVTGGMPWMNLTRAGKTGDKVEFNFRHALAKLNVQVDAEVDESHDESSPTAIAAGTKVFLRSVKLSGFALQGSLNLNNTEAATARWTGYEGAGLLDKAALTFHDGRADGQEGFSADAGETLTFNPQLAQKGLFTANETTGVTATAQNFFMPTSALSAADKLVEPAYVIPTGQPVNMTVAYDIETADDLAGVLSDGRTAGISMENVITLNNIIEKLEAGHNYTLRIHLGLNSVRFDVNVDPEWEQHINRINLREPQVGDLYFADGTWGTREEKPEQTPVGIIFSTSPSEKDKAMGYTHGYVMALKDFGNMKWSTLTSAELAGRLITSADGQPYCDTRTAVIDVASAWELTKNDLDGLSHCNNAFANAAAWGIAESKLTSFLAARNYGNTVPAPASSSGWYLPSIGQQLLWFDNFGGFSVNDRWSERNITMGRIWQSGYTGVGQTVVDNINNYVKARLTDSDITSLWGDIKRNLYHSSTEISGSDFGHYDIWFDHNSLLLNINGLDVSMNGRAVLAF